MITLEERYNGICQYTHEKEINIESIVTIHYFEYMKNFVFQGESHDFWELLYVDKGEVSVRAENEWLTLHAGDIIFHRPNEFHAFESIGEKLQTLSRSPSTAFHPPCTCSRNYTPL